MLFRLPFKVQMDPKTWLLVLAVLLIGAIRWKDTLSVSTTDTKPPLIRVLTPDYGPDSTILPEDSPVLVRSDAKSSWKPIDDTPKAPSYDTPKAPSYDTPKAPSPPVLHETDIIHSLQEQRYPHVLDEPLGDSLDGPLANRD